MVHRNLSKLKPQTVSPVLGQHSQHDGIKKYFGLQDSDTTGNLVVPETVSNSITAAVIDDKGKVSSLKNGISKVINRIEIYSAD